MAFPDRFAVTRRTPVPAAGVDTAEVERQVRCFAVGIGCVESNVIAAVTRALRWGGTTALAVEAGKKKARELRAFQPQPDGAA